MSSIENPVNGASLPTPTGVGIRPEAQALGATAGHKQRPYKFSETRTGAELSECLRIPLPVLTIINAACRARLVYDHL